MTMVKVNEGEYWKRWKCIIVRSETEAERDPRAFSALDLRL